MNSTGKNMNLQELINAVSMSFPYKIKQPRSWALCCLMVPESLKEKTAMLDLSGISGNYLLGFNVPPQCGDYFPYEGHIWKVAAKPIQFPTRYKTQGQKRSPLVIAQYVESFNSEAQMLTRFLELSSNS